MTYKEYVKIEFENACKKDWFDPEGNSSTAVSSRGFFAELRKQVSGFNYSIIHAVDLKELGIQLLNIIMWLSLPITYFPFLIMRTIYTRSRAKKEVTASYNKKKAI